MSGTLANDDVGGRHGSASGPGRRSGPSARPLRGQEHDRDCGAAPFAASRSSRQPRLPSRGERPRQSFQIRARHAPRGRLPATGCGLVPGPDHPSADRENASIRLARQAGTARWVESICSATSACAISGRHRPYGVCVVERHAAARHDGHDDRTGPPPAVDPLRNSRRFRMCSRADGPGHQLGAGPPDPLRVLARTTVALDDVGNAVRAGADLHLGRHW